MNTYKELSEIFLAARTAVEFVVRAKEDGKLTLEDFTKNLDLLLTFASQVKTAIQLEGKLDLTLLSKEEVKDLLEYNLNTIFLLGSVSPEGDSEATYKELAEIFNAIHDGVLLFAEVAEDGKISLGDLPGAIDNFIDLAASIPAAIQVEGTIDITSISSKQAGQLLWILVEDIYQVIDSISKLATPKA